ncbi:hypothetical protein ERJ75_000962600 [Trypanosoma vivax]|uniref:Uncharacterized protein n=1 Tax=Trypanosoma vivax (strain Y486) TaxID=1055687 RepID=G0U6L1_TRYVY|nr:hypothetical protein ERJ75_000962600 [Trypanosoma vivax]CCC51515.1 conserved hypothetical protein [Trypanosoma vivax Y486]
MPPTGVLNSPSRCPAIRPGFLADNRALLQVLSHSENTSRSPISIVSSARSGGIVTTFSDIKFRYSEQVLLPSSCDLTALSLRIAEGLFVPFFQRALGDQLPQHTIVTESGCFELLCLPVLLFPDCFYDATSCDVSPSRVVNAAQQSTGNNNNSGINTLNTSCDLTSSYLVDVFELHRLRLKVSLLLLRNINEVLRDAKVWRLKTGRQKAANDLSIEIGVANSVIALFYEVKMLLLCCILSTEMTYTEPRAPEGEQRKTAQSYFDDFFSSEDLYRLFEERSRPHVDGVLQWFDNMLCKLTNIVPEAETRLYELLNELNSEVLQDGKVVTGIPQQLIHRAHDNSSANVLQIPLVQVELPSLEIQPGELSLLLSSSMDELLLDTSLPSKLTLLFRRCASTKLTAAQLREAELELAANPWRTVDALVAESLCRQVSNPQFLRLVIERNCSLVAKLVQWLQGSCAFEGKDKDGSIASRVDGDDSKDLSIVKGENGVSDEIHQRLCVGESIANEIVKFITTDLPFSITVAQFVRELVNGDLLTEEQLRVWMGHSLSDLKGKQSTTIGCFASLVVFLLLQRRWELPVELREAALKLCSQHRQQQDCAQLADLLRRNLSS